MKARAIRLNIPGYNLFSAALNKFDKDDCVTLSLSVSFVFLLSIIPFSTLSILIFDLNERPCSKLQGIRPCLLKQFELPEGGFGLTLFLDIAFYNTPVGPFADCRNVVAI